MTGSIFNLSTADLVVIFAIILVLFALQSMNTRPR